MLLGICWVAERTSRETRILHAWQESPTPKQRGSEGKRTIYENAIHILDPVAMVVPLKNDHAIGTGLSTISEEE